MLVFGRRIGEEIVIDEHILVSVVEIKGNQMRIGVQAPRSILIDRQEIHDRRGTDWGRPISSAPSS
jgi:carbon storage regulator